MTPSPALAQQLQALLGGDREQWLSRDPLRFPRNYTQTQDIEIAAVIAASLAYGRVSLFSPVIQALLAICDEDGGPWAFVRNFDEARSQRIQHIQYRWNKHPDFALLFRTLQAVYRAHDHLGVLFTPGPALQSLGGAIDQLRKLAPPATEQSRGFRTFLPHPAEGSACKRWVMLMRWMVRREYPDLGLWTHLKPADLLIPVDVHVGRIARFIGLTQRSTADWKTATDIAQALQKIDPNDPIRYDFALAHLGISSGCKGFRHDDICPACPLNPICTAEKA